MTLDRGYYLVTVDYETNIERGCVSTVTTPDFRDSSVRVDEVPIVKEKNQISYRIFIRDDGLKVNIENREWSNQQDGWLLIKEIGIRTYAGSQWYSFLTLLIGCVLLNTALYAREKYQNKLAGKQQRFVFVMLVFTILAACLAQGTGYLFDGHDLDFHLKRIEGLKEGLLQGDFPVKIHPLWLHDNGYAVGVFYGDLLLYIPALLRIIGFSIQSSYQFYAFMITVGTVLISYFCFSRMAKSAYIGLAACIIYVMSMYRLNNVYVRGAVGEYTAMMFLPLIIYGLWQIFTENPESEGYRWKWIMPTVGYSGLIVSHILSCEMVGLFTIITCFILWKRTFRRKTFVVLTKVVLATAAANAWFLVPFFNYYFTTIFKVNNPDKINNYYYWIQKSGTYFPQIFSTEYTVSGWDQYTTAGMAGEMPQIIGLSISLILAAVFIWLFVNKCRKKEIWLIAGLAYLTLFMASNLFPYDWLCYHVPQIKSLIVSLQYPWRFFTLTSGLTCFLLVLILREWENKYGKKAVALIMVGLCFIGTVQGLSFMSRVMNERAPLKIYDTAALGDFEYINLEYIKREADYQSFNREVSVSDELMLYDHYTKDGLEVTMDVANAGEDENYIDIPISNYRGYHAVDTVTGKEFRIGDGRNCCIRIYFEPGYQGNVHVYFREPKLWRAAELFSLFSILAGGSYIWWRKKKKNQSIA